LPRGEKDALEMTTWRLILRELQYRRTNFCLGVVATLIATGCVVAAISLMDRYNQRSQLRADDEQAKLCQRMAALEDDYRKISLGLGFNVMILPKEQSLADFYADDFAAKLMPEAYARQLAEARLASINHILPILQQRISWPERQRTIQLIGTRGEMALMGKGGKATLQQPVSPGRVVVGYELHRSLDLAVGKTLMLRGQPLVVSGLQPQRGNQDDITLWINLAEAQKLLDKQGRINAIMAIECNCAADRLSTVRGEIARVLPDAQVVEFASQALARAEARRRAAAEATESVERQQESRSAEGRQRGQLFAFLIPLVIGACAVWAGLLALGNVRSRIAEIGILRTLGVPSARVLTIFLARAVLIGLAGGLIGFLAGWMGSWLGEDRISEGPRLGSRFSPLLCAVVLVVVPLFSAAVSALPAIWAAGLDPVESLKEK
jgi:putative ABC transport system permease protein